MAPGDALSIYGHRTRLLTGSQTPILAQQPGKSSEPPLGRSSVLPDFWFRSPLSIRGGPLERYFDRRFSNKHRRRRSSFFYRREVLLSWIVRGSRSRVCNGDNRTAINFYTIIFVNCELFAEASNEWIVKTIELKGSIMNYVRFTWIKMFQQARYLSNRLYAANDCQWITV